MENRDAKLQAPSDTLNASTAERGGMTDDKVAIWLDAVAAELELGLKQYEP